MTTLLADGIRLNESSSMRREWFILRDTTSPVVIEGPAGVNIIYRSEAIAGGGYRYHLPYSIVSIEPVVAVEIKMHIFDVFGRFLRTLVSTEVVDMHGAKTFDAGWGVLSGSEASEAFASVLYVSTVRTATGRLYEVDRASVLEQVRKIAKRLTDADLDPKREPPKVSV